MPVPLVSTHQVRAFATIGTSRRKHEIAACSVTYELSGIPFAKISMPIGRLAGTNIPASAHRILSQFDVAGSATSKISIYIRMNDAANHPNGEVWPPDDICIFEGYVTGAGLQKTRGTISLMLQARHWLSDIAYSSCLSANSHPGNPLDYLFPSSLPGAGSALGAGPAFMTSHIDHELTRFDLQTDFWVRGLHEWFLKLADEDFLDLHKISSQRGSLVSASDKNNKSVRRALARMTGGYKYVPLVLDANCNLEDVARAISQAFDQQTFQSFSSTTMWNKLVGEFAPNFMFAICPRVKNAYAVPYVPGLRHPWQVIRANEYTALDSSAQMDRLLRAVGIIGTRGTRTGFNLGPPQSQTSLGGYYSPPHIDDGVIMFKQAPSWLGAMTVPSAYSNSSINYGGVTGSSTSPGQGKKPTVASPSSIQDCQSTLLDRYAETMYVYEMLHGRRGSLAGKLRLDIAPGSSVLIEGSSEGGGTAAGGDALSQSLFATVISVTINLDGQRGHAGTSFQLSHIRSETENSIDGFSVDRPPLWKNEWRGTSLVDNRVPGIGGI